jgi:hypothetical protein
MKHGTMWMLAAAVLLSAAILAPTFAQDAPADRPPRRGGRDMTPEQMQEMRQRMQQRMQDAMRERLGATEDEWKVLWPRIEKVQTLQRQTRGGDRGRMFMGGRTGRRGTRRGGEGGPEAGPGRPERPERPESEMSDVQKKTDALRQLLDKEGATPAELKAAMDDVRKAREKAQQELEKAQKDLKEVITVRQEAVLFLMGLLS